MAKIFRKIRQKLFIENRISKYLLYALGEIILVVLGILIALQVNIYNENRKAEIKEKKYLISMKNELENNLNLVKIEQKNLQSSIDAQRDLFTHTNSDKDTLTELQLSNILGKAFANVYELKYQDGTFKELLYSGGLTYINNDSIKNEVTSWEGRMIPIRKQEKGVYDARDRMINFMIDQGVFKIMIDDVGASSFFKIAKSTNRNSTKILLKSTKFENLLSYHFALNVAQKGYYSKLEKEITNLLRMVENNLETF